MQDIFYIHVLMLLFQCPCKLQYGGEFCDQCAEGYYNYPECTRRFFEIQNLFIVLLFTLLLFSPIFYVLCSKPPSVMELSLLLFL